MSEFPDRQPYLPSPAVKDSPVSPEEPARLLPTLLLLASVLTTTLAGVAWAEGDLGFEGSLRILTQPSTLAKGLPFAISILVILLAHEMGHYLTCRRHGIRATLPYVIPVPPPLSPFGTFGAVIKIKSLFENRRQLFDVGVAGPLAGFIFIPLALALGLSYSTEFTPSEGQGFFLEFGEPLLFKLASGVFYSGNAENISLHPIGWAAWFGMLATSLNLLPTGQLDGGHIVYSLFGPRVHRIVSFVTLAFLFLFGVFFWYGYLFFGGLVFLLGFKHPPTAQDYRALGRSRLLLALLALLVLVLTFIPVPVQLVSDVHFL